MESAPRQTCKPPSGRNVHFAVAALVGFMVLSLVQAKDQTQEDLPHFSLPSGIYTQAIRVELSAPTKAGIVRYTTDGSDPKDSSPRTDGTLEFTQSTLLKARIFAPGREPGPVRSQSYTLADATLADFKSNLPLVILNTFAQASSPEGKVAATIRIIPTADGIAPLMGASEMDERAEINLRGNSSQKFPKRSYTVKLKSDQGQTLKLPMLGLPADSDWVLYAPYFDRTLIRDVLAYELSNAIGRYAPRTRFVEVFRTRGAQPLNQDDYLGVYVLEEKIKQGKDRVQVTAFRKENPEAPGGYLFKKDHPDPMETGFATSRGVHLLYVYPKETEILKSQHAWLKNYMNRFEKALYGPKFTSTTEGYSQYLDVDAFIDHFWLVEMTKNVDGFRWSCFMHLNQGDKLKLGPIWDWDQSFGNANFYDAWNPQSWYWPYINDSEISWYSRLMQDPDFDQRQADRWTELRQGAFSPESLLERVDQLTTSLGAAQKRNTEKWHTRREYQNYVLQLKMWIESRIAWLDQQFLSLPDLSIHTDPKAGNTAFELKSSQGEIYYTLDGSDPRAPGGAVASAARRYESRTSVNGAHRLFARVHDGKRWSGPVRKTDFANP